MKLLRANEVMEACARLLDAELSDRAAEEALTFYPAAIQAEATCVNSGGLHDDRLPVPDLIAKAHAWGEENR